VVDESAVSRRILLNLVRASGGDPVIEASNAEQALAAVEGPLDIVITEWNLPDLSGLDLIGQLLRRPENKSLKAVLLTTRSSREDVLLARQEGVSAYVLRPFSAATLRSKLDPLMRPQEVPDETPTPAPPPETAAPRQAA
jgi:two-component system chemotaxis response regulator CheY